MKKRAIKRDETTNPNPLTDEEARAIENLRRAFAAIPPTIQLYLGTAFCDPVIGIYRPKCNPGYIQVVS